MSYQLIATTTLTTASANITFTGIPQNYTDLWILLSGKIATGGFTGLRFGINFNGSPSKAGRGFSAAVFGSTYVNSFPSGSQEMDVAFQDEAAQFSNVSLRIFDYARTDIAKMVFIESGSHVFSGGSLSAGTMVLSNTDAITTIVLADVSSINLTAACTASLYGISKGSGGATVSTT